ncbi:MAG: hypothetical protein JO350_00370 [Candidatus Eremiobacteraeota bacterium]|nr:hypothetical protein [Candidatus Eremiobacteraeota bacterium]
MFDEFRYGAGTRGGPQKQGRPAAQPARVSQRGDARVIGSRGSGAVVAVGGNDATLAVASGLRPTEPGGDVTIRLIPLAWTPIGVVLGTVRQEVGVPLQRLYEWIDRTFSADDEGAFVPSMRDVELLARIGWNEPFPEELRGENVVNLEDLPPELVEALERPSAELVQCATCRRLCVRDDFKWNDKQLCAWDYHATVFGRRGPWHSGTYEPRHFSTLPVCAYVVEALLEDLRVETVLILGAVEEEAAQRVVAALLVGEPDRAHLAVRTGDGLAVLREG